MAKKRKQKKNPVKKQEKEIEKVQLGKESEELLDETNLVKNESLITEEQLPSDLLRSEALLNILEDLEEAKKVAQSNEEKFRTIFENVTAGIVGVDPKTKKFYFANNAMSKMLGYSNEELLKMGVSKIHPKKDISSVIKNFNQQVKGKIKVAEALPVLRKDKKIIYCDISSKLYTIDGKKILLGIFNEVTEKIEKNKELFRMKFAIDSSGDAIGMSTAEGKHFYQNQSFSNLFGYSSPKKLARIGGGQSLYVDKKTAKEVFDYIMSGKSWTGELLMKSKKGRIINVYLRADAIKDEKGKIIGLIGIHRDITKQKESEEKLGQSEQRFREAFETSAIGMALVGKNGEWLDVNDSLCNIVGYSKKELLKKTFQDITHPEDLNKDLSLVKKVLKGKIKTYQMEKRYIKKDKEIVWVLLSVSLVKDIKGNPLYFVSQIENINDRKKAEEKVNEANLRNQAIVKSLGELVYNHYVPEDIILWEGYQQALGLTKTQMGKGVKGWINLCHPEDRKRVEKELGDAIKGKRSFEMTYRFKTKNGYRWFEDNGVTIFDKKGKLLRVIGVMKNIEERINFERKLKESQNRFELIQKGTKDGVWDWNLITNEVYFSPNWKRMLGYGDDEIKNKFDSWIKLLHPDDKKQAVAYAKSYITSKGKKKFELEFKMRHKKGHYVPILARAFLEKDSKGKVIRMVGTHFDLSEIRKVEKELVKKEEEYENLIEEVKFGVIIHDDTTKIINANKEASRILGLTKAQLMGKKAIDKRWKFYNEDEEVMSLQDYPVNKVLKTKKELKDYVVGVYIPEKNKINWALVNAVPEFEESKNKVLKRIIISFTDFNKIKNFGQLLTGSINKQQIIAQRLENKLQDQKKKYERKIAALERKLNSKK